jgi:hypothetical protein
MSTAVGKELDQESETRINLAKQASKAMTASQSSSDPEA